VSLDDAVITDTLPLAVIPDPDVIEINPPVDVALDPPD
jgi:hypothetical protein